MGGIVSRLNVEKGERVVGNALMAGTEVLRIANLNRMEVQVEVSENDIPRVSLGDPADIEVDAYLGRKFKGKVSKVANSANTANTGVAGVSLTSDQVTNFIVTIDIDPASYRDLISEKSRYPFRPGMSASVDINTQTLEDVLSIPIQAVTTRDKKDIDKGTGEAKKEVAAGEDEGGAEAVKVSTPEEEAVEVVFVVSADTARLVTVSTGIQDDTYIQILSGLNEGDEVITGPYATVSRVLKNGLKVTVVKEEDLYKVDK
jgi:HlyD family secretion protein